MCERGIRITGNGIYEIIQAPIIERSGSSDSNLVGHASPVEVARFNPLLFNGSGLVALGSQDCGISVFWTNKPRAPLSVRKLFSSSVLDLAWYELSNSGLYAGTIYLHVHMTGV